jgi:phage baseplate assembly protein V
MMQSLSELDRRLANLLRYGVIAQLDEVAARATVDLGEVTTDWLPWFALRAGPDTSWWAPEPGEQVMVFSPSGELAMGTILPGIYSNAHPANGNAKTLRRTTYADGTVVQYDRAAHQLTVDTSASNGAVVVNAGGGNVTVNCAAATVKATDSVTLDTPNTHCTGGLTVDGATVLKGTATVQGATALQAGATVTGAMTASGAVTGATVATSGGIGLATHHHTAQGSTSPTTAAQA